MTWKEKITFLAVNPDKATIEDVERLAGNLSFFIRNAPSIMEQHGVIDSGAGCYAGLTLGG